MTQSNTNDNPFYRPATPTDPAQTNLSDTGALVTPPRPADSVFNPVVAGDDAAAAQPPTTIEVKPIEEASSENIPVPIETPTSIQPVIGTPVADQPAVGTPAMSAPMSEVSSSSVSIPEPPSLPAETVQSVPSIDPAQISSVVTPPQPVQSQDIPVPTLAGTADTSPITAPIPTMSTAETPSIATQPIDTPVMSGSQPVVDTGVQIPGMTPPTIDVAPISQEVTVQQEVQSVPAQTPSLSSTSFTETLPPIASPAPIETPAPQGSEVVSVEENKVEEVKPPIVEPAPIEAQPAGQTIPAETVAAPTLFEESKTSEEKPQSENTIKPPSDNKMKSLLILLGILVTGIIALVLGIVLASGQ